MADQETLASDLKAGELLMWLVKVYGGNDAEARALEMGRRADVHRLGAWGVFPIGLGDRWWFDLTLARDLDLVFATLLFDRMPDERY